MSQENDDIWDIKIFFKTPENSMKTKAEKKSFQLSL